MEMTRHEQFRELCRSHGLKCTSQRFAVYDYVAGNQSHPTVDEVWQSVRSRVPSITRESVFRILMELADMGIVYRMDRIINARFDGLPYSHGHLICNKCGAIIDFELPKELSVPGTLQGFQASRMELRISGLCAQCAASTEENINVSETLQ